MAGIAASNTTTCAARPLIPKNCNSDQANKGVKNKVAIKPTASGATISRSKRKRHCKPTATMTTGTSVDEIRCNTLENQSGKCKGKVINARISAIKGGKLAITRARLFQDVEPPL